MTTASTGLLADMWGMHNGDMGGGWWIVMMIGMLLFWGAVIFGIIWLVRSSSDGWKFGRRETSFEILERRFAEGAISADEYQERRAVLTRGAKPRSGPDQPAPT